MPDRTSTTPPDPIAEKLSAHHSLPRIGALLSEAMDEEPLNGTRAPSQTPAETGAGGRPQMDDARWRHLFNPWPSSKTRDDDTAHPAQNPLGAKP